MHSILNLFQLYCSRIVSGRSLPVRSRARIIVELTPVPFHASNIYFWTGLRPFSPTSLRLSKLPFDRKFGDVVESHSEIDVD